MDLEVGDNEGRGVVTYKWSVGECIKLGKYSPCTGNEETPNTLMPHQ